MNPRAIKEQPYGLHLPRSQSGYRRMIVLLTGPPGVGKSTVADGLRTRHPGNVEIVSFGHSLFEAVRERLGTDFSYSEFRQSAAQVVTSKDIDAATAAIVARNSLPGNACQIGRAHV